MTVARRATLGVFGVFLAGSALATETGGPSPVSADAQWRKPVKSSTHSSATPAAVPAAHRATPPPTVPAPARVDPEEPVETESLAAESPTRWYGWQILLSDAASVVLVMSGVGDDSAFSNARRTLALVGYLGAPSMIHAFHGEWSRIVGSLGLRLGLPVAGGGVGAALGAGCEGSREPESEIADLNFCQLGWIVSGVAVGAFGAMLIDALLAHKEVPGDRATLWIAPEVLVSDRETRFGLRGSF